MLRTVPALFAVLLALPLPAELQITRPHPQRAIDYQLDPSVASDGTDFLAVWEDGRGGIYAARVTAHGEVLDPFGIVITDRGENPDVTWDGDRFLIVWNGHPADLFITPVSREGGVGEAVRIGHAYESSIASTGDGSMVAARGSSSGAVLYSLSSTLDVIATRQLGALYRAPKIAASDDSYFVAWHAYVSGTDPLRGLRTTAALSTEDPFIDLAPSIVNFEIAAGDDRALVAWNDESAPHIMSRLFSDRLGDIITVTDAEPSAEYSLTATSSGFSMLWSRKVGNVRTDENTHAALDSPPPPFMAVHDIYRTDFTINGEPRHSAPFAATDASEFNPAAAANGETLLGLWLEWPLRAPKGISRLDAAISKHSEEPQPVGIALSASAQETPRAARVGDRYAVVWAERFEPDQSQIFLRTLDASGQFRDAPVLISPTGSHPAIACDDDTCLVAWIDAETWIAFGKRISSRGEVLDEAPLQLSHRRGIYSVPPAVSAGGHGFGVLTNGPTLAHVNANGEVTSQEVEGIDPRVVHVALAWDGVAFVAAWYESESEIAIRAARIFPLQRVEASDIVSLAKRGAGAYPSVGCLGRDCIVSWHTNGAVRAAEFVNGSASQPLTIRAGHAVFDTAVTAAASRLLVTWLEASDGEVPSVRGAYISRNGNIQTIDAPVIPSPVISYDIAFADGDDFAVTYSRRSRTGVIAGAERVFVESYPRPQHRRRAIGR